MSPGETYADQLRRELWEAAQSSWLRTRKIVSVLGRIVQTHDAGFIKTVAPLLWDKEKTIVYETAASISVLLQGVPVRTLPRFDEKIREGWLHWHGINSLDRAQIGQLKSSPSWWQAFAVLASHPSGFVRQAALNELATEETGESLPFILLRTADWVEVVQTIARNILHKKLGIAGVEQWERCLPLVFRMRGSFRAPSALLDEIERVVASRPGVNHFAAHTADTAAFFRYRLELAKKYGSLSADQLIEGVAKHPYPNLRLLACDLCATAEVSPVIREKYSTLFLEDKSPIVRARAYWRIANANPEKYAAQIQRALMDKNAAVQDTARGAWKKLLHGEAHSFYKKQLAAAKLPSAIVAALRGLQAEGELDDESLVRPFLQHDSARVRTEALRTLAGWKAPDTAELLQDALRSPSPSYSKSAGALLLAHPRLIQASTVKQLLISPAHRDSQKIALRLSWRMPKWSSLPLILFAHSIPSCSDDAAEAFRNWNRDFNRVQSRPSKMEATDAAEAFQAIAALPLAKNRDLIAMISYLEGIK